jgi:formyl-CoA transferase
VVVENFRPGVATKLGLGIDAVMANNPNVVYCSISGFGSTGPYRDRPGYDTVGQAMSGLLGLLTDFDDPKSMGISLSDHITGLFACYGILAALVGRASDGRGRLVETSLLQATTSFLAENAARFLDDGEVPTRETRARIAQAYAFKAKGGDPFVVHLSSPPKFWHGLIAAIDRPDLLDDERFIDRAARVRNYDALHEILQEIFATAAREDWLRRLEAADVPAGPIYRIDEALNDPGVQSLELVQDVIHPTAGSMKLLGSGVRLDRFDHIVAPPPTLVEHTDAVLRWLGYNDEEIDELRKGAVI